MKISEVIVVEGKNDIMAVKRAVDAFVISTSGQGLSKDTLEMLKTIHSERGIIILTDPDTPGEKIRAIITEQIPTASHAFVKKKDALLHNDVGIENANIESIQEALKNVITFKESSTDLTYDDLVACKLVGMAHSKALREQLCSELSITYCNGKTLLKRLEMLNISKRELYKHMEDLI